VPSSASITSQIETCFMLHSRALRAVL
jgi:hypothetical protein